MHTLQHKDIVTTSLIQAGVNTVINATINYFMIRGQDTHLITTDSITSGSSTVIGHSIFTAVLLAVVFTLLGFNSHRKQWPNVAWIQVGRLAVHHAIYAFGLMIILGVLWQNMFPDVRIGTLGAATIAGGVAGVVSGITNFSTLSHLWERVR